MKEEWKEDGGNGLFQPHIPKNFYLLSHSSVIPYPASRFTLVSHIPPNLVHANEAIHTQFIRGRRSNMASLNHRHIGRLLHRLHFCRSYRTHLSVSVFFNSQSSVILVSLCSFFVPKAAVCS